MTDREARPAPMPPTYRDDVSTTSPPVPAAWRTEQPCTMVVDGQTFTVTPRPTSPGTYDLDWTSGPHNYGFSLGTTPHRVLTPEEIRDHIRTFLSQIDPTTGYLAD